MDVEEAVLDRYTRGARVREEALCCPVNYAGEYLKIVPAEIVEKDYGCGDPTAHVRPGEVVLDLGCGCGKLCYIAAQVVGSTGRVVGVDFNGDMLALARAYQDEVAGKLGYRNVDFRRGRIQDLALDLDAVDRYLQSSPIRSLDDWETFRAFQDKLCATRPLVADASVDVVMSNCVLNLVRNDEKANLFREMQRVLKDGGRAVISDIVADEPIPPELANDPVLWSGCIAGAFQEEKLHEAFAGAGFFGMTTVKRDEVPWRTVRGIEFRSVTVVAYKGKEGPCRDCNQAVIYRGPWSRVVDDDGHTLVRGVPMAVCEKTFRLFSKEPYRGDIMPVSPRVPVASEEAASFDCKRNVRRDPREIKGADYRDTTEASGTCCPPANGRGSCC